MKHCSAQGWWIRPALIIGTLLLAWGTPKLAAGAGDPPPQVRCLGDCNDDGRVVVNEIVTLINMALDRADLGSCPNNWPPPDCCITPPISPIVEVVGNLMMGCPDSR